MNMVATPNPRTFASDADLVLDAAHGDAGAFESLFRRHVQSAWRLAQAAAGSNDDAGKAVSDAFARLLRDARRSGEEADELFPTQLLAAVYRNATTGPQASDEANRAFGGGAGVPVAIDLLVARAFRSLPARWRAALWLLDVEGFSPATTGLIVGLSSPAVVQLRKRGGAGLEQRVVQGGGQLPLPDLSPVLAAGVAPFPTVLAARSRAKWRRSVSTDRRWSAPVAGWLVDRTSAPLKACAVGLCAVGIIAAAVVGQHDGLARTTPTSQSAAPGGVASSGGNLDLGGTPPASNTGAPATTIAGDTAATGGAAGGAGAASGSGPGGGAGVVADAAPTIPAAGATTAVAAIPPTGTTMTTVPPVPTTPTTRPPPTAPPPVVAAAPVVQAGLNTGPLAVGLGLGRGTCTGARLLGVQAGCTSPTAGVPISLLGRPLLP